MVHRPPDSRLLTNLIHHEKDYIKHLFALFPLSHAALTSLSAYAIASPSSGSHQSSVSPSQTLTALVEVLASSDDALHRYTQAVERWREELAGLKDLEEDVGAVLRDREILQVVFRFVSSMLLIH
ncbi:hypothetical protein SERLA73DRAFT_49963 [Serpula lacrymans var. lacrymans S7.3]|uniref:DH domain-containing protein n=1 Tax=Serpula lacrymans var. lacrymans (strain S7.3) TaxID=936435 RepID=F8PQX0_SERL3|nr:hypothetical protein SERLA73DRAFT_49963 [Serpula lacrymans var. lacrymans S7.3]